MHRVVFETMGCRLNQAETAILQSRFVEKGYTLTVSQSAGVPRAFVP
jgi:tRNA A37 methylthiotransferase MiaB